MFLRLDCTSYIVNISRCFQLLRRGVATFREYICERRSVIGRQRYPLIIQRSSENKVYDIFGTILSLERLPNELKESKLANRLYLVQTYVVQWNLNRVGTRNFRF